MSSTRCVLAVAGLLIGGTSRLLAQTQESAPPKPPAAVSTLPAAQPTSATGQANPAATAAPKHHVEVKYTDGKLAVEASNASLNEILREVAAKTGIKITGGVADDRVFGSYGPSAPSVVLDALLEGTGSNMLLVDDAKGNSELILTPRRGGPTPPSPNTSRESNDSDDQSNGGAYVPPLRPYQAPVATGRGPLGASPDSPGLAPGSDSGDGNGSKTPQQIYEQLQRTMQQQQKQTTSSPPQ